MSSSPTRPGSQRTLATIALLATTAVWGATFVTVQDAVEQMPVMPFLFWRFLLAFGALAVLRPASAVRLSRDQWRHGLQLGLLLGSAYVLQTFGLLHTSATVSGFITGMFVVFTPIIGWALVRQPVDPSVWTGVGLATLGLALISLDGFSMGYGELLTLGCAALFAGQIVGLGQWSTPSDAYGLTVLQLGVVALLCAAAALVGGQGEGIALPPDAGVWAAVVFLALVATALAFLAQTWAQAHMSAPRAAIVLTTEPVFAGIFGVTLGGDSLTLRIVLGGACILAAMSIVEFGPSRPRLLPRKRVS